LSIADVTSPETQIVSFTVNATDADNDALTYDATNLPSGANFDAGTRRFIWTPSYLQAGEYEVHFLAHETGKSGFDDETVYITITNLNRNPVITDYLPTSNQIIGHRDLGETFNFIVNISDNDTDDEHTYEWYYDDLLVSTISSYSLYINDPLVTFGDHLITVKISDGYDTIENSWELDVKVPVELTSFAYEIIPREGVRFMWETSYESNNSGFNVLRSNSINGEYEKINSSIIPSNEAKKYRYLDHHVQVGRTYYYKLEDISISGKTSEHDPIKVTVTRPETYELSQNYPNPFNPVTKIHYQIPNQQLVTLKIYNLLGQEIISLVDEPKEAGYHTSMWNGLDKYGNQVSSGIYYYRIMAGAFIQSKKMVLIR